MEFVQISYLQKRGIITEGQLFFIQLWLEQFHLFTVDTYRCRAMNTKSIINELIEVIEQVDQGIWDSSNIKLVALEALSLIENDRILCNRIYCAALKEAIGKLTKKEDEAPDVKVVLLAVQNELENNYWSDLKDGIRNAIEQVNFEEIDWFTKTIATELINAGYSREYLYDYCKEIYFNSNADTFDNYLSTFLTNLSPIKKRFTIIQKMYPNRPDIIPTSLLDISFNEQLEIEDHNPAVNDYLISKNPRIFASCEILAQDPFTAAILAKAKIGHVLDLLYYGFQFNNIILLDDNCLVSNDGSYIICTNNNLLVGHVKDNKLWLETVEKQLSAIKDSEDIRPASKEKIIAALRYFRLSKESLSIEQRFLHLWIALEQLVRSGDRHKSIIEPVRSFIPKSLSLQFIRRTIRNVFEDLKRCKVEIPTSIKSYNKTTNKENFIDLARNKAEFNELLKADNVTPLLNYRLHSIQSILLDSGEIIKTTRKNQIDIDLHLARMYRIRNKIVHNAAFDLEIAGITANLLFYVSQIINTLLYELTTNYTLHDLRDVYVKYQFTYDQYSLSLTKDGDKNSIDNSIVINPLLYLYPNVRA